MVYFELISVLDNFRARARVRAFYVVCLSTVNDVGPNFSIIYFHEKMSHKIQFTMNIKADIILNHYRKQRAHLSLVK